MTDPTPLPPSEVTVPLRSPIASLTATVPGSTIDKLVIRDSTAGMWLELDKEDGTKADLLALAILTGTPPRDLGKLGVRDFRTARAAMNTFVASAEVQAVEGETSRSLPLLSPIKDGHGETITALELREPTASDLDAWDNLGGVAKDLAAVAKVAGLSDVAARQLGVRDFRAAAGWIAGFFEDAPTAGA